MTDQSEPWRLGARKSERRTTEYKRVTAAMGNLANTTRIAIYCGSPPENTTERRLLTHLARELSRLDIEAVILANFYVGNSSIQIDVVVATGAVACVTEVKGFRYPVEGGLNGPWVQRVSETETRSLGWKNPYTQALGARFAVVDALAEFCGVTSEQLRGVVKGFACLYPSPMHGSQIPKGNYKAGIGGFDDLFRLCTSADRKAVSIDTWQDFARHLGLVEIAQEEHASRRETEFARLYASALASIYPTHAVPFIDPPVSGLVNSSGSLSGLTDKLERGEQLLIIGASGTGKTLLLERILLRVCKGTVPIMLEARDFEGSIGAALRRAVALATSLPLLELLRRVRLAGYPLIVLVDGLNECDNPTLGKLLRALVALRLRYGAQVVLTAQAEITLPPALVGEKIQMVEPTTAHFRRIVEALLKRDLQPHETEALVVVSTAQDAVVLANTLGNVRSGDGRYALYSIYTRQKIGSGSIVERIHRSLADLAFFMRERFLYTIDLQSAVRLTEITGLSLGSLALPPHQSVAGGLLVRHGNRLRFMHDLVADYFASEYVLRQASNSSALAIQFARPLNAGLREFLVAASASTADVDELLNSGASRGLLEAMLRGRCGDMARRLVLDRLHHILEQFGTRLGSVRFDVVSDEENPERLRAIRFAEEPSFDFAADSVYLSLMPAGVREGLLPEILNTLRTIDYNIAAEITRLRRANSNMRGAWINSTYQTVFGLPGGVGTQHLYRMLASFNNIPLNRGGEPEVATFITTALGRHNEYKPGQLLFLLAAFKSFAPLDAAPPADFSRVVETLWNQRIGHLRLMTLDAVRTWGRNLDSYERTTLGDLLHSWLSNSDPWMNSIIFDALRGLGELRDETSIESIVQEYRSFLSNPPTENTAELAMTMYASTYDHPLSELYYEAYHEHLMADERHQIVILSLQADRDPMFKSWVVSELVDEPTPLAVPYLQPLALAPSRNTLCDQDSVWVFNSAIAALAILGAPLVPYESASSIDESAWRRMAHLLYALHRIKFGLKYEPDQISRFWTEFERVDSPAALDVIVRLHDQYVDSNIGVRAALGEHCRAGIGRLCRVALSRDYVATTHLRDRRFHDELEDDHRAFAFDFLGTYGRHTDLPVIRAWVEDGRYGERAHDAAKRIEGRYGSDSVK